jgi:hypothetical protein
MSARDSSASTRVIPRLTFNGSTTGYSSKALYGVNGSTTGSDNGGSTYIDWSYITGDTATASTFSNTEVYIPNYLSSNNKSVSIDFSAETNSASSGILGLAAGLWSNTAAITSITFTATANFVANSTFSLYGIAALGTTPAIAPKAYGGNIIDYDGTYWIHTFLTSGTFTPQTGLTCDYLVVAGGAAGGGTYGGGGGGAGALRTSTGLSVAAQTYAITVGAGGSGSTGAGSNGTASVFDTITSSGGGGGGIFSGGAAQNGGSGGGGSNTLAGGTGTTGGNNGGTGSQATGGYPTGAGGGGASAVGASAVLLSSTGGAGGNGSSSSYSGSSITYAGGGGGGVDSRAVGATGGAGGSGGGGAGSGTASGSNGTINLGGGGGGAALGVTGTGGAGGSGIVIIRYPAA